MTKKLYYDDPTLTSFQGTVLSCDKLDDNSYYLVLDRTSFFPEEGGQNADSGTIDGVPVIDVQIKSDVIYHKVGNFFTIGSQVTGEVSFHTRFDYMQQHSGEHILSGLVHSNYGLNNVGFHLGKEEVTLDFDGILSLEQLRELEQKANEAISLNIPVQVSFPSSQELSELVYRSKIALEKDVRIVSIQDYDICACCAPHVTSTGQIGMIKIASVMKHRGGIRVHILCGFRALKDYTVKQDNAGTVSALLSVKPDLIAQGVSRLLDDQQRLRQRFINLQEKFLDHQIATIPSQQKHVLIFLDDFDTKSMRNAVNTLCSNHPGFCGIFLGNDETGYQYILGSKTLDCKKILQYFQETFLAKGGGSLAMIQGTINATQEAISSIHYDAFSEFSCQ